MPGDDIVYSPIEISGNRGYKGDKAKGIVCKPMPRSWYDYHANKLKDGYTEEDASKRQFNLSILADRKPYFMRYIYPELMKQYNIYIKNTDAKCRMLFQMSVEELQSLPSEQLTDAQAQFLYYYYERMPVSMADSVMNRICRKIESALSVDLRSLLTESTFDTNILRSGAGYSERQYYAVSMMYQQYRTACADLSHRQRCSPVDEEQYIQAKESLMSQLRQDCMTLCSNGQQLCDILVDLCYLRATSKRFVWDICSNELIHNLLAANGGRVIFPVRDADGDIVFRGRRYRMEAKEVDI